MDVERMVVPSSGIAALHRVDVFDLLQRLDDSVLPAVSELLAATFTTGPVFSTVFSGERESFLSRDVEGDLKALAEALPPGVLLRTGADRDVGSHEPAILAFIRQVEGRSAEHVATLAAPLTPEVSTLLPEVAAAGFTVVPGPRSIGLLPPPSFSVEARADRTVRIGGGLSWQGFRSGIAAASFSPNALLDDLFATPMQAAVAGAFAHTKLDHAHQQPWQATFSLPSDEDGLSERTWFFRDAEQAEAAFHATTNRFEPYLAETIPALDLTVGAVAGMWRQHRFLKSSDCAALRCVFSGPAMARRKALIEASWRIERLGGVCTARKAPPYRATLDAVAAAAGAARLELDGLPSMPLPNGAKSYTRLLHVRGSMLRRHVVWYVRDLSRSIDEARLLLGYPPAQYPANTETDDELDTGHAPFPRYRS